MRVVFGGSEVRRKGEREGERERKEERWKRPVVFEVRQIVQYATHFHPPPPIQKSLSPEGGGGGCGRAEGREVVSY